MIDLSQRSTETELMDRPETSPEDYARSLADLAQVNRVTLTHRPVLAFLDRATRDLPKGAAVSVLDVASGQGDLLRSIHRWGTGRGLALSLAGIDLNPSSAVQSAAATPPGMAIAWRTGDVFDHLPDPKPDFIVSAQFAHHLDDADVVRLLGWLEAHSGRGWFVADLHRHWIPYYGFRLLCWAMGWHRIVRIDGTISVARSFVAADWRGYLAQAGLAASVRWRLPFRLCVSRLR